jgi:hypothetical protein
MADPYSLFLSLVPLAAQAPEFYGFCSTLLRSVQSTEEKEQDSPVEIALILEPENPGPSFSYCKLQILYL